MRTWSITVTSATIRCWRCSPASLRPGPARRGDCAPLAGESTLNRLEHAPAGAPGRHHRVGHDAAAIEAPFVGLFLEAHRKAPPRQIILDLDATDVPLHGHQGPKHCFGRRRLAGSSTATTMP